MNRLLLYVHFNKYGQVSSHVMYQLEKLRPLFSTVFLISNSPIKQDKQDQLTKDGLVDELLVRENRGFDFAAWQTGMRQIGMETLKTYDSVTLMNDTCFGPLWDFAPIYERFEKDQAVDFWGLTNHRQTETIKEHIQSYFFSFKKPVIASATFQQFWESIHAFSDVQKVIDSYETQLTSLLLEAGFRYQVVFDTVKEDFSHLRGPNFSFLDPATMLAKKIPLIKIKSFVETLPETAQLILDAIKHETSYPIELIIYHLSMVYSPVENYLLGHKYCDFSLVNQQEMDKQKIAIHLHVYYVDLLGEFLQVFQQFHFHYDLFMTTDTKEKEEQIKRVIKDYGLSARIVIGSNLGRDIFPMLQLKKELEQYDIIGHFHTKKSTLANFLVGKSWRRELIEMLLKPADQIVSLLSLNPQLGLVIADIPTYFRYVKVKIAEEAQISQQMEGLWQQMNLTKPSIFQKMDTFVMSYGTFVWFKYDALKPLFELSLTEKDMPREPLSQHSILHAIERIFVYLAWGRGYDFRISPNPTRITPFIDNQLLNTRDKDSLYFDVATSFTPSAGIRAALKYVATVNRAIFSYIVKRLIQKVYKRK